MAPAKIFKKIEIKNIRVCKDCYRETMIHREHQCDEAPDTPKNRGQV